MIELLRKVPLSMTTDVRDVTVMLQRLTAGDHAAVDELMPLVYEELRTLAERYLRAERAGHTLQATALVHEAYLRLVDGTERSWANRTHFFATAAIAIRRILVDYARRRSRLKRGGELDRVSLDALDAMDAIDAAALDDADDGRLLVLDDALDRLATLDSRKARIVELRFFAGLTVDEVAAATEASASTVARDWRLARAWLRRELEGATPDGP